MRTGMISHKSRQRLVLTALIVVFSMPFVAAWFIYNFSDGRGDNGGNFGELIVPPPSIPDLKLLDPLTGENKQNLRGKWNVLYMVEGDCTLECTRNLEMMLGLRRALDKDSGRLQLIVATADTGVEKGLSNYLKNDNRRKILLFPYVDHTSNPDLGPLPAKSAVFEQGKFYIIDPLGNLILRYSSNSDPEGLYSDIKRLLRYSRIG